MKERSSSAPLIAGFMGGFVSTTLLFPLDIIKVRMQVSEGSGSSKKFSARSMRILGGVVKYEGFRGLYSGWTPAVIGSAVSWGGYFYLYEGFKRRLVDYKVGGSSSGERMAASSVLTPLDNFVLACGAGGLMVLATNPVWLVKLRMQLQLKKAYEQHNIKPYNGMFDAFRTIAREEGYLALYKGSGPAMLLTTNGGVQFVVYEYLRKHFHYRRAQREETSNVWERLELSTGYLTMGAVSKFAATAATYPLQVIKARMQQRAQSLEFTADGEVETVKREYAGMTGTARKMWAQEGLAGFYKGTIPTAVRVAPGAAITFLVYEGLLDWLN